MDGIVVLPLYHGTSSVWYESIMQYGLGGRNIIAEFGVVPLVQELARVFRSEMIEEDPGFSIHSAELIGRQAVTGGGFNFRHGNIYLCAGAMNPAMYASDQPGPNYHYRQANPALIPFP